MNNITIIGLGVIGGSFAKAIRKTYRKTVNIYAIDIDKHSLNFALEKGWIDKGETSNQTLLQQTDLVIFALYPNAMKQFLQHNRHDFKSGAILTDTTGVKRSIIKKIIPLIPPQTDFIFGHPMAGREKQGIHFSSSEVFQNANYILTPTTLNKRENINWLTEFIKTLGFKTVSEVSPFEHDAMIAYTSQLTHILSVALMNSDNHERDTAKFVGDSFRDLTRIANINEYLWSELFFENKELLLKEITTFENQLNQLKTAITNENYESMYTLLRESSKRRQQFEKQDLG